MTRMSKSKKCAPQPVQKTQDWWWKPGKPQGPQPGIIGFAQQAATEAITMLENKNNALPLSTGSKVSVFGRIQIDYFFVGYGSGGDIRPPYRVGLLEALRRHPGVVVNEELASIYETWVEENPASHGGWGSWPTNHPEMPLCPEAAKAASFVSDVAIVIIGRSAGEDRETTLTPGSWYLTDDEKNMLEAVSQNFGKVIVLINSGNIIDMSWVKDYKIDALLYVWQGGMCAGAAIADILAGDQTPSGRLHATIANDYENYPGSDQFGKANDSVFVNYVEDIFVGYRYFETFAPGKVRYPFGYGLSYAAFDATVLDTKIEGDKITVTVKVTNTSNAFPGKEVVQVYHGAPQGKLDQPAKRLIAYAKTNLLHPGESETVAMSFDATQMAAYDDSGVTGHKSAWVMEVGEYPIYVGKNVADTHCAGIYTVTGATRVVEQLEESLAVWPKENAFNRYSIAKDASNAPLKNPDGTYKVEKDTDRTPTRTIDLAAEIKKEITENTPNLPYRETPLEGEKASVQLLDVCLGKATLENFIAQMTIDELAELCRGGGPMGHPAGNPGNAAVFAGHNQRLREFFGIPAVSTNDGPSGLRISGMATLCPIGTALACTWNDELVEDLYAGIGREMLRNGVDLLLAPGLNLQRNPLNGRNFEYFSEDPLLNGNMAASMCRGIQSEGVAPTPKHFVANNQETNRARGDSRVSERALRELYLRGFENIVKTAGVPTLMSSYNMVNGVWCPYSFQLQHRILRRQWGFDGLVMTDWWIKRDDETTNAFYDPDFDPGSGEARLGGNAYRVRGRVDLLMPGDQWLGKIPSWNPTDREYDWTETNPATAVRAGLLEIGEIQLVAKNVLKFAMQSARFRIDNGLELHDYGKPAKMFEVTCPSQHMPKLDMIYLDGKPLPNFDPDTPEYVLFARSFDSLPEVTIKVADALKINIQQATSNKPAAAISLQSADGGYAIYRVYWDNRSGMVPHAANPVFARPVDIIVNGKSIPNFHWRIPSYTILVSDTENAMVAAVTPENVSCTITRKGDGFIVRAESDHQAMEYRVKITTDPAQAKLPPLEFYSWIKPPHEHDDVVIPVVNMAKGEATRVMAAADRFYSSHPNQGYMLQVTQPTTDPLTPEGRHVSWLEAGRYVLYNLNVAEEGWYNVRARYASGTSGAAQLSLDLLLDTADVAAAGFKLNPTGGWGEHDKDKPEDWVWSDTQQIYLAKGPQKLTVLSGGGFNLNFLEFVPVTVQ